MLNHEQAYEKSLLVNSESSKNKQAAYWQPHFEAQQVSGLSKRSYSEKYGLDYHRLVYWCRKLATGSALSKGSSSSFIPISIASQPLHSQGPVFCTLEFGNNKRLFIHDERGLKTLLNHIG